MPRPAVLSTGKTRREFLASLAGAAVVAGFDPFARTWVKRADAARDCRWPRFARLPELDGAVYMDLPTRALSAGDQGNIAFRTPAAVLVPASIEDIAKMIRFCNKHDVQIAGRGHHHTMNGQSATCGLAIEMTGLNEIHYVGADKAIVDAGVIWKDLAEYAFARGYKTTGLTGFLGLSVGGVLSVGGCPMANHKGAMIDRVRELVVVTGEGKIVECSERHHRDLFEAVLGGLGQCGIICRATIDMTRAKPMARTFLLHYPDIHAYFADQRILLERGEIDEIFTIGMPPGTNQFVWQINATVFFDPAAPPPDPAHYLRGLSLPTAEAAALDRGYLDYATFTDQQVAMMQAFFQWDKIPKPWFDVWLPDDAVERYVGDITASLTPEDVGPFGFILVFPQRRSKMTRPFFRVPDRDCGSDWIWLFDVTTTGAAPVPNPEFAQRMLTRNKAWYERARDVGGTCYPIGAQPFRERDWIRHYGEQWSAFARAKRRFDPRNLLTHGPGIFTC